MRSRHTMIGAVAGLVVVAGLTAMNVLGLAGPATAGLGLNVHVVTGPGTWVNGGGGTADTQATCPPGEVATGGGYSTERRVTVTASYPYGGTTWRIFAYNERVDAAVIQAYVVCARDL